MSIWRLLLIFVVLLALVACQNEFPTQNESLPNMPLMTDTAIIVSPTQSPTITMSSTITQSPTLTPTDTPSDLPTETPSPTSTPEQASLTINQNAICRIGPGLIYDVRTYLTEGTEALILGSDEDQIWWFIEVDRRIDLSCWVSEALASLKGDLVTVPVLTPPPLPLDTPTPTPQSKGIVYYLIAENTGGPVGCGDSLLPVFPGINFTPDMETNVIAALNALFSQHTKYVNGLLNPVYESRMKAKHLSFNSATGTARIQLGGTFVKPIDVCEAKRMRDQVFYTVYQFEKIKFAAIYLNNVLLGDLMEK